MEDYDDFVQRRLSLLRGSRAEQPPPAPERSRSSRSSLIQFHGQAILPPLLSEKQREEMQSYKEKLKKPSDTRKSKADRRVARVHNILHSVQLRKAPTLEQFFQEEAEISTSKYSHSNSISCVSRSQTDEAIETKCHLPFTSKPGPHDENISTNVTPLTSMTYSAMSIHRHTPSQNDQGGCSGYQNEEKLPSQPTADPFADISHQSVSSGYVTHDIAENATSLSGLIESLEKSCGFGTEGGVNHSGGAFLYNTTDTTTKMPDIFSHPPIDGEELEKLTVLSSHFVSEESQNEACFTENNLIMDVCCTSPKNDSVIFTHSEEDEEVNATGPQIENSKSDHQEIISLEVKTSPAQTQNQNVTGDEYPLPSMETSNPGSSEAVDAHQHTANQPQIQRWSDVAEPAGDLHGKGDNRSSDEPYRLSLQALLKKSQEYRQRQRMLRNKSKNTKILESVQEKLDKGADEYASSDKENDESPHKRIMTMEGNKPSQKGHVIGNKVSFSSLAQTSPKESWENEKTPSEKDHPVIGQHDEKATFNKITPNIKGSGNCETLTEDMGEISSKNTLVCSLKFGKESKDINNVPQSLVEISTDYSTVQKALYLSNKHSSGCNLSISKKEDKVLVPAPQSCMSPVQFKSKATMKVVASTSPASDPKRKVLVDATQNVAGRAHAGHRNDQFPKVYLDTCLVGEVNLAKALSRSSDRVQRIDQLELNLSSLKLLISDLESTLIENIHSQNDNHCFPSDFMCKDTEKIDQTNTDHHIQVGHSDYDCCEERLSPDGTGVQWSDRSPPVKELSIMGSKDHWAYKKQQPSTQCITSLTQRMRIPGVFREVLQNTYFPSKGSVPSNTSNQPTHRRTEITVEGEDSSHSVSLNQSYDVDRPSGLWLLEGSGSDLSSSSEYLTLGSGGGGQGGVSKAKRRLLMHANEGKEERRADCDGGAAWIVRPHSSTPKASAQCNNGSGAQEQQPIQVHEADLRGLLDEQRSKQADLLMALAERYRLLQSVSFPCAASVSHLRDALTSPTQLSSASSQPSGSLLHCYRPLVAATVKGYLTRRLLRTERVEQLQRTIRDTQQFLQALPPQTDGRGEFSTRQDVLLQERVRLQLRSAHYDVYDIFFSLPTSERMKLISWDRELTRERELRRQSGKMGTIGQSSLSAATQKSLQRKRRVMIRKKAAGRHQGSVIQIGHKPNLEAQPTPQQGRSSANPWRVPKTTTSSRS